MGNPPYQKENKKNDTARGGTGNNLYLDFVTYSLNILSKDGYLLYIHPLNWRKINSNIFSQFINRDIVYLKLNYGGEFFENVSVKTDYYLLKNSKTDNISTIEYINKGKLISSQVRLSRELTFIPNIYNEYINYIFEKINIYGIKYECKISSDCHKIREHVKKQYDDVYKYKLYNTSGNPYGYYSSKPHKHQYFKKVILSNSGKLTPIYDNGELGTTQDSMYILVDNKREADAIINTINTQLFTFIINICQWGNFRNEASLFTYLKYPDYRIINNVNDESINKYYKLTLDEINFVNSSTNGQIVKKKLDTLKLDTPKLDTIKLNTIKHNKKDYYLIDNKVYRINNNKTVGDILGDYVNGCVKIIKVKNNNTTLKDIAESIEIGINIEEFNDKKTKEYNIIYYTKEGKSFCNKHTYNGKYILCVRSPTNQGTYYIVNGKFSANREIILIKLKQGFDNKFDEIYEYIKNNFDYKTMIKEKPMVVKKDGNLINSKFIAISYFNDFVVKLD